MNSDTTCKKWVYAILTALLAVICGTPLWWNAESYKLSFTYQAEKENACQIYYAEQSRPFSAEQSFRVDCKKGKGHVTLLLPARQTQRLRIDFGTAPGKVSIRDIRLKGKETSHLLQDGDFTPKNIKTYREADSQIDFTSTHKDPQLIYNKLITAKGKRRISVNWLIALAGGGFYLYFAVMYLVNRPSAALGKQGKLHNVEFLRVYFTFAVMMLHFCTQFRIWTSGSQGVEFFFILSGYLLVLTYNPKRSLIEYAKQRYIRFVPLIIAGGLLAGGGWRSFEDIFLLQSTGLAYATSANTPAWYIAVLFWCSLFYLGLMKHVKSDYLPFVLAVLAFIFCLAIINTPGRHGLFADLLTKRMLRGLACMGIGMLLACFCKRPAKKSVNSSGELTLYTLAELGILLYLFFSLLNKELFLSYWIYQPISHVILLWLFIRKKGVISRALDTSIFSVPAKYCLSIYLTHSVFYRTVQTFVKSNYPGWLENNIELSITLAILGSCILGIIAYYLIELPCAHYLSNFLKKKPAGNATA